MAIKKTITKKVLPKAQNGKIVKKGFYIKTPESIKNIDPGFFIKPNSYYKKGIKNDPGFNKQSTYKGKAMKNGGSTEAWTRKEGKNKTGGLNAKGVASYRAANPGSKLKMAVTTKPSKLDPNGKAAKRRKSFCARSAGQMANFPKAAKDPNSRLRLARKKWNC
jgi:hypothetical protein